jgi:hypothetical protein
MEENSPFDETPGEVGESGKLRDKSVDTMPGKNGGILKVGGDHERPGRPPGSKNRATILNKYIDLQIKRKDPITGEQKELSVDEFMELEMIAKVLEERDLPTYKEIKDTRFGKLTDNVNVTGEVDLSHAVQISIGFEEPSEPKESTIPDPSDESQVPG